MKHKISLIGAGTGTFAINLIKDLCLTQGLDGSTICLMDIDERRLNAVHRFCVRYAREQKRTFEILRTTDRRECLQGADFVINSALDGGYARMRDGWNVAKRWGYRFGGSLHIVHDEAFWVNFGQLQLMESIYQDMLELCPQAWYIMVANPVMAATTYFHRKYPGIRFVGMCHGYNGVYRLCSLLGLDRSRVSFEVPGVNHFVWLTRFCYDGQDAMPLVDRWVDEQSARYFEACDFSTDFGPKTIDLYRRYGRMPIGDTCTPGGGSWGWEYHVDGQTQLLWREDPDQWYNTVFSINNAQIQSIIDAAYDESVCLSERFSAQFSDEPMIPLLEALACDRGRMVIVNTINDGGFVEGVPLDFEVEIPAWVDAQGVHGIRTTPLPKPLQARLLRDRVAPVETELHAYAHHSLQGLVELVMLDPWTRSRAQAEGLVREILDLPGLEAMKAWYR